MRHMVLVISDLHFEEEAADIIGTPGTPGAIDFRRNVPGRAFEEMMVDVMGMAETHEADKLDFVLAGDIFDLHRTQLWFSQAGAPSSPLRPYVDCGDVRAGSPLEAKILSVLDHIVAEPDVSRSLAVFRRLAGNEFLAKPDDPGSSRKCGFPTELHYFPGNHDRLANATPDIRSRIRGLLGLPPDHGSFSHQLILSDPPILIRHGHEYDRFNFAVDLRKQKIAVSLPDVCYDTATFGDFITVMVAARLPNLFRSMKGDAVILDDPVLQAIYCRLLEFDDLRPQSKIVDFFLNTTVPRHLRARFADRADWQRQIWKEVEPVVRRLLDEVVSDPYFLRWSRRLLKFYLRWLMRARPWRFGIPLWAVRFARYFLGSGDDGPQTFAAREEALETEAACFIVAGHTHKPNVAHLFTQHHLKKYFVDTGTWRNAILAGTNKSSYGRVNATTYVAFYGAEPAPGGATHVAGPERGFEFWTGFNQNWPVDGYDQ